MPVGNISEIRERPDYRQSMRGSKHRVSTTATVGQFLTEHRGVAYLGAELVEEMTALGLNGVTTEQQIINAVNSYNGKTFRKSHLEVTDSISVDWLKGEEGEDNQRIFYIE